MYYTFCVLCIAIVMHSAISKLITFYLVGQAGSYMKFSQSSCVFFFKVIWYHLYKKESGACVGTLAHARGYLGATNVPEVDPQKAYYQSAALVDKFTNAYIIAGALDHFGMNDLDSGPTQNAYSGPENDQEKTNYLLHQAKQFVESVFEFTVPDTDQCAPRSNSYICPYCAKEYKRPSALRRHEHKEHGHPDPKYVPANDVELHQENSSVFTYTKQAITLMLLRLEHDDALHMGDGERIMRVNNYLMLLYKASKCPKYAYGMLEAQAQVKALLPPRLAYKIMWNRTVNHRGEVNSNFPVDLDIEHNNGYFKEEVRTYRGDFTDRTLKRVSRSASLNEKVVQNFDKVCEVRRAGRKHTKLDCSDDIVQLSLQFKNANVFDAGSQRQHRGFDQVTADITSALSNDYITDWISNTLKVFSRKHYYTKFQKPV